MKIGYFSVLILIQCISIGNRIPDWSVGGVRFSEKEGPRNNHKLNVFARRSRVLELLP